MKMKKSEIKKKQKDDKSIVTVKKTYRRSSKTKSDIVLEEKNWAEDQSNNQHLHLNNSQQDLEDKYKEYLQSVKEICDLALKTGDLKSALSAKKLEADWIKQNRNNDKNKSGEKIDVNCMSQEDLESLIDEIEEKFR